MYNKLINTILCAVIILFVSPSFAQDESYNEEEKPEVELSKRKFLFGFEVGSYFANKHTAASYDGYGFDIAGNKNVFLNSVLYRRLVLYNNTVNGQQDYVAQALNVDHEDWSFTDQDMPINMRYNTAFLFAINSSFRISKNDLILLHYNILKLNAVGNYTIGVKPTAVGGQNPGQYNTKTFTITGSEKRLVLQLGYQRIMGNPSQFNMFYEVGANMSITKMESVKTSINTLNLDLTQDYLTDLYGTGIPKGTAGVGAGMFFGAGFNIAVGKKFVLQLVYDLNLDRINIGSDASFKPQHTVGFRVYGNFL